MDIKEQMNEIAEKICMLYPEVDHELYLKKISEMKIVESDDITDKRPVSYQQATNTLKLNIEEINKDIYDLHYYVTVTLLMMLASPAPELEGLRYGYYSGVANNLVGNFVKETKEEVVPGVDIYEGLRDCVAELSAKIGPSKAVSLCSAHSVELFHEMYIGAGLEKPKEFLNQLNYLLNNLFNIKENQVDDIVQNIKNTLSDLEPQRVMSV